MLHGNEVGGRVPSRSEVEVLISHVPANELGRDPMMTRSWALVIKRFRMFSVHFTQTSVRRVLHRIPIRQ